MKICDQGFTPIRMRLNVDGGMEAVLMGVRQEDPISAWCMCVCGSS